MDSNKYGIVVIPEFNPYTYYASDVNEYELYEYINKYNESVCKDIMNWAHDKNSFDTLSIDLFKDGSTILYYLSKDTMYHKRGDATCLIITKGGLYS